MSNWPHTSRAWQRLKINFAILILMSVGGTAGWHWRLADLVERIETARDLYFKR